MRISIRISSCFIRGTYPDLSCACGNPAPGAALCPEFHSLYSCSSRGGGGPLHNMLVFPLPGRGAPGWARSASATGPSARAPPGPQRRDAAVHPFGPAARAPLPDPLRFLKTKRCQLLSISSYQAVEHITSSKWMQTHPCAEVNYPRKVAIRR